MQGKGKRTDYFTIYVLGIYLQTINPSQLLLLLYAYLCMYIELSIFYWIYCKMIKLILYYFKIWYGRLIDFIKNFQVKTSTSFTYLIFHYFRFSFHFLTYVCYLMHILASAPLVAHVRAILGNRSVSSLYKSPKEFFWNKKKNKSFFLNGRWQEMVQAKWWILSVIQM